MTTFNKEFTMKIIMLIQSLMIVDEANNNAKDPPTLLTVVYATQRLSTSSACSVDVDWFAVRVTPMHQGLKLQALCTPLLVSSFNSRGAPCHTGIRDLC
jgi:hypothetical protein